MFDALSEGLEEQVAHNKMISSIKSSEVEDVVADKYLLHLDKEISDLSNQNCSYYIASNPESGEEFYAIVFNRSFNPDLSTILAIMNSDKELFITPIAASFTRLSTNKVKHLVLIVEKYDYTENLTSKFNEIGKHNTGYISTVLLPFLISAIKFATENNFNCGVINPNNILYKNKKLILKEPFVAYPHQMQPMHYLATELLDAHHTGMKTNSNSADIFALGVTILSTYFATNSFTDSADEIRENRLNSGSFLALVGKRRLSDELKNQIKGCLSDNVAERWKIRNLQDWATGMPSSSSQVKINTETFAPISFNAKNYSQFRPLASALYRNWTKALDFFSEDRVIKWIQRGTGKNRIIDNLDELVSRDYSTKGSSTEKEEKLFKALQMIDPQGPIRYGELSTHLSGINNIAHFAFVNQNKNILNIIIKICLKKLWEDFQKYDLEFNFNESSIEQLSEISNFYHSSAPGCNIERVIYFLNPHLPCLSPLVFNDYITTPRKLLEYLDKLAESNIDKELFDKHIISFLANKVNLKRDLYLQILQQIPPITDTHFMHALIVVVTVLKNIEDMDLPNISSFMANKAYKFINFNINNTNTRKELENKINNASEEADLETILKIIANNKIYEKDQRGYYKACNDVNNISKKIRSLANDKDVKQFGIIFGQRITVLISYLLFMVIMIFTVL